MDGLFFYLMVWNLKFFVYCWNGIGWIGKN